MVKRGRQGKSDASFTIYMYLCYLWKSLHLCFTFLLCSLYRGFSAYISINRERSWLLYTVYYAFCSPVHRSPPFLKAFSLQIAGKVSRGFWVKLAFSLTDAVLCFSLIMFYNQLIHTICFYLHFPCWLFTFLAFTCIPILLAGLAGFYFLSFYWLSTSVTPFH